MYPTFHWKFRQANHTPRSARAVNYDWDWEAEPANGDIFTNWPSNGLTAGLQSSSANLPVNKFLQALPSAVPITDPAQVYDFPRIHRSAGDCVVNLAGLQYHWIGQISEAERQRLEASVKDSSTRFAGDFTGEIRSMSTSLDFRGYEPAPAAIAARYRSWAETSGYPDLVRTLYVVRSAQAGDVRLFQINLQEESMQLVEWRSRLAPLRGYFQRESAGAERRNISNVPRSLPWLDGSSAVLIPLSGRPPEPQRSRGGPGPGPGSGRGPGPQFQQQPPPSPPPDPMESWLIAELDETSLRKQVFPALVARDFPMTGDQNYRVAVVTIPSSVAVFSSGNTWTAQDLATFDYAVDLIGGPGQFGQIGGIGRRWFSTPRRPRRRTTGGDIRWPGIEIACKA